MKEFKIKEANNGFQVYVDHCPYVFKSTEILVMLEFIGNIINGRKVEVKER